MVLLFRTTMKNCFRNNNNNNSSKLAMWCLVLAAAVIMLVQSTSAAGRRRKWPHVAGGSEVERHKYPWYVSLSTIDHDSDLHHLCGGVLISQNYVLTAAHCFDGRVKEELKLRMGIHDKRDRTKKYAKEYDVDEILLHEMYNITDYLDNDIALVKTKLLVETNRQVKTKPLPTNKAETFVDHQAIIVGLGEIEESLTPDILREKQLTVWGNKLCSAKWNESIKPGQLCADNGDGDGSCRGDSGGPLHCGKELDICGISSYGFNDACGTADHPSVFTRVTEYLDWIKKTMGPIEVNWNGQDWAYACNFPSSNDISTTANVPSDRCGPKCSETRSCSHFTWTTHNDGTCILKSGTVEKLMAQPNGDLSTVCGINANREIGGGAKIEWNGQDWARGCDFPGNDLVSLLMHKPDQCGPACENTKDCTHYTWSQYRGGTCWMKKGAVSKELAVMTRESSLVCGINPGGASGSRRKILWNGNWAHNCDFPGNDFSKALVPPKLCGPTCENTPGCTHFSWNEYEGGTCWMKKGFVSKESAVIADGGVVCGVSLAMHGGRVPP